MISYRDTEYHICQILVNLYYTRVMTHLISLDYCTLETQVCKADWVFQCTWPEKSARGIMHLDCPCVCPFICFPFKPVN